MEFFKEIQMRITTRRTRLEEFEDRIIFMSMFKNIDWTENEITRNVCRILKWSEITQRDFSCDIGLFSVLVKKKHGTERTLTNLKDHGSLLQM